MACAMHSTPAEPLLAIEELAVSFPTPAGEVAAVADFSLAVRAGECVGVVGESGAGKSQALLAVMGLLPSTASIRGRVRFEGKELIGARRRELNRVRGARLAMIFQDPLTSLTPHMRVGAQIGEVLVRHRGLSQREARKHALVLLHRVRMTDPTRRLDQYPHELSGGMRQRAMIAMALACGPSLLIADEPTTALDVTIQAQILTLLAELKRELGMALLLVSHDFGVIAGIADRVAVMYAGRIVELGSVAAVLKSTGHPYTRALLRSMPRLDADAESAHSGVRGQPPDAHRLPAGCAFHPRCELAQEICRAERPRLEARARTLVACHFPLA
jgi:oligopeptide/dipeptide ABC transporter ATP-binding protein